MLKTGEDNPKQQSQQLCIQVSHHRNHLPPAHLGLINLGMGVQKLLKLCWVDVLSSPNNHVLASAYDPAVAVLIQARKVPVTTPQLDLA